MFFLGNEKRCVFCLVLVIKILFFRFSLPLNFKHGGHPDKIK